MGKPAEVHEDMEHYYCLDCGGHAYVDKGKVRTNHDFMCHRYPIASRLALVAVAV